MIHLMVVYWLFFRFHSLVEMEVCFFSVFVLVLFISLLLSSFLYFNLVGFTVCRQIAAVTFRFKIYNSVDRDRCVPIRYFAFCLLYKIPLSLVNIKALKVKNRTSGVVKGPRPQRQKYNISVFYKRKKKT